MCVFGLISRFFPTLGHLDAQAPLLFSTSIPYGLNRFGSWDIDFLGFLEIAIAVSFRRLRHPFLTLSSSVILGSIGEITFVLGTLQIATLVSGQTNLASLYQAQILGTLIVVTLNSAAGFSSIWFLKH